MGIGSSKKTTNIVSDNRTINNQQTQLDIDNRQDNSIDVDNDINNSIENDGDFAGVQGNINITSTDGGAYDFARESQNNLFSAYESTLDTIVNMGAEQDDALTQTIGAIGAATTSAATSGNSQNMKYLIAAAALFAVVMVFKS